MLLNSLVMVYLHTSEKKNIFPVIEWCLFFVYTFFYSTSSLYILFFYSIAIRNFVVEFTRPIREDMVENSNENKKKIQTFYLFHRFSNRIGNKKKIRYTQIVNDTTIYCKIFNKNFLVNFSFSFSSFRSFDSFSSLNNFF